MSRLDVVVFIASAPLWRMHSPVRRYLPQKLCRSTQLLASMRTVPLVLTATVAQTSSLESSLSRIEPGASDAKATAQHNKGKRYRDIVARRSDRQRPNLAVQASARPVPVGAPTILVRAHTGSECTSTGYM